MWTPDSRRLIFSSERAGGRNLFWQAADGSGAAERLLESPTTQYPLAVSPDGRQLIYSDESSQTGIDLMAMELDGARRVTPLVRSQFSDRNGIISPDGSGQELIYVSPTGALMRVGVMRGPSWSATTPSAVVTSCPGSHRDLTTR